MLEHGTTVKKVPEFLAGVFVSLIGMENEFGRPEPAHESLGKGIGHQIYKMTYRQRPGNHFS